MPRTDFLMWNLSDFLSCTWEWVAKGHSLPAGAQLHPQLCQLGLGAEAKALTQQHQVPWLLKEV